MQQKLNFLEYKINNNRTGLIAQLETFNVTK